MRRCSATLLALFLAAAAGAAPAGEDPGIREIRGKLSAAECDRLARQTELAELVCVAEAVKVRDEGLADCWVTAVLKGEYPDRQLRVRFSQAPGGVWPPKGAGAVYFLTAAAGKPAGAAREPPGRRRSFDLAALAEPSAERVALVRLAAAGRYQRAAEPEAPRIEPPAPESLEGMALDAAYVALGAVQEVALPEARAQSAERAAVLAFRIERVLKGDLEPGLVYVYVPAARPELFGPERQVLAPKAGPAALFFRREPRGGSYRLLSPYRGYAAGSGAGGAQELAERVSAAVGAEGRLRRAGLVGNPGGHDSVRDTIVAWQEAWNSKTEIEACLACYSRRSPWRRKWESGAAGRRELARTMADYPATINVICDRVEDQAADLAAASVRLQVISKDPASRTDYLEVRPLVMSFVHENGQWLILDQGD